MHLRNRVVWNEGLLIKPQHFQQQQRHFDYCLNQRIASISRYLFGLSHFTINYEHLSFGKIVIDSALGVMPDGSVFDIPQEDVVPEPLEISDASVVGQCVYLCIPLSSNALMEIDRSEKKGTGRFQSERITITDVHSVDRDSSEIEVAPFKLRVLLEHEDRSAYASIAIARIIEKRPDGSILLDTSFIPCLFNVKAHPPLHRAITEIASLVIERAKNIALRISSPSQGSVADVSDFMLLQVLNKTQVQMQHLSNLAVLHPERLYEYLVGLCGELASFTDESRLSPKLPSYQHDLPTHAFSAVIRYLRQSLSTVQEPRAVSLQLDKQQYGIMVAPITERELLNNAEFYLAIKARMPIDELRRLFIHQTKIASIEKIREYISSQSRGIPLKVLPVAPRQLPYHAGYIYLQLDKTSPQWKMFERSAGFALHISGVFESLEIQFWAIRD